MKVLQVSVRKEGVEHSVRWSQNSDGTITIFLNGPAEGKQHLSLHGTIPTKNNDKMPLPNISLVRASVQSTTLQVFCHPEINLELTFPDNESIVTDENKSIVQKSLLPISENQTEGLPPLGTLQKTITFKGDMPVQGAVLATTVEATTSDIKINSTTETALEIPRTVPLAQNVRHDSAKVHLADVKLAWQSDGACWGAVIFDLEPGGQRQCPLRLPNDYKLVHVSIDGLPTSPLPHESGIFQLPLVSYRLSQRIEVVFQGRFHDPLQSGPRNIAIPSLGNLPVVRTLWALTSPPSLFLNNPKAENISTIIDQQLIRFRNAAAMITSAETMLQSDDTDENLRWYQIQTQYLKHARSALKNTLSLSPDSDHSRELRNEMEITDQQQSEFAKRIGMEKVWARVVTEAPATEETAIRSRQELDGLNNADHFVIEGEAASIIVSYKSPKQDSTGSRIFDSLILVTVTFIFIFGIRRSIWKSLIKNRPYALCIAAGLAWWCWLWPSFLGLVVVLFFLIVWWQARRNKSSTTKAEQVGA
jgi:hypothetical protein